MSYSPVYVEVAGVRDTYVHGVCSLFIIKFILNLLNCCILCLCVFIGNVEGSCQHHECPL